MATLSAVSAVAERVDCLLLAEGAPASWSGDLRDGVLQLRSELGGIEQFLADADTVDNVIGEFKKMVTQLVYDIEDAVESYALQEASSKGKSGLFRCLFKCSSTARRLREDLHIFKRRIDGLKLFIGAEREKAAARGTGGEIHRRRTTSSVVEPQRQLVRSEHEMVMKDILLGGESKLSVIAICGMGGIGKTTLAKSLYNDRLLVSHFDNRAWVTVGMEFQARDILETLLFSLDPARNKDEIARLETMELIERLYKAQKGRRYLVVLDDVWSTEAWDTLRFAFPDDRNGSRIVITTRSRSVAAQIATYTHEMQLLTEEESWQLFRMRLGVELSPEIENIAKQIAEQSRGLPLAITAISGLLRTKDFKEWAAVLDGLQGVQYSDRAENILALSYNHLPFHLKPCFLYLGHFPPDEAIPVEKLCLLWIAEGLISMRGVNNKARVEVAEDYFNQLVERSLVLVVEYEQVSASRRFKSCQVHDLIRDLCLWKGKEENFFEVIDFGHGNKISSLTRRLAIYLNKFEGTNDVLSNIPDAKHIRSILFFDTDESLPKPTWPIEVSDLKEFQWTRVLDFDGVNFQVKKLPKGIEKLIYLRYLSFRGCYLQEFPSSLSNFPFLETLDLRVRVSCVLTIPNVLRKLSSLRHLYFPVKFQSSDGHHKLKLDSLKKLEILENFHAGICDAVDVLQLENLQIFSGVVDGDNMDLKNTISSMNGIKFIRHSSLVVKQFDSYSEERRSIVAALLECNALHSLEIEGYLGVFPRRGGIGSNITEMIFNGSEFSEDPMPILGKLPKLRSLVLCNDAFVGKEMVCSEGEFPVLKGLKLATLQSLKKWEMEIGAMPSLTILTIEQCDRLEMLPDELPEIPTLEKLMIGSMPKGFLNKVKEMIAEQRDLGNEELTATFYDC